MMSGCRDPMCSSEFCGNFSSVVSYQFFLKVYICGQMMMSHKFLGVPVLTP